MNLTRALEARVKRLETEVAEGNRRLVTMGHTVEVLRFLANVPRPAPEARGEELCVVKHAQSDLWIAERADSWARWDKREHAMVMTRAEWKKMLAPDFSLLVFQPVESGTTPDARGEVEEGWEACQGHHPCWRCRLDCEWTKRVAADRRLHACSDHVPRKPAPQAAAPSAPKPSVPEWALRAARECGASPDLPLTASRPAPEAAAPKDLGELSDLVKLDEILIAWDKERAEVRKAGSPQAAAPSANRLEQAEVVLRRWSSDIHSLRALRERLLVLLLAVRDEAVAAERERAARVCEKVGAGSYTARKIREGDEP